LRLDGEREHSAANLLKRGIQFERWRRIGCPATCRTERAKCPRSPII